MAMRWSFATTGDLQLVAVNPRIDPEGPQRGGDRREAVGLLQAQTTRIGEARRALRARCDSRNGWYKVGYVADVERCRVQRVRLHGDRVVRL